MEPPAAPASAPPETERAASLGARPYPFSRSIATGIETAFASRRVCSITSSSVTSPSARPSVNAKPELVVANALKPSSSSMRAEPASQGLGMMNGSPSWRAWKLVLCELMLVGCDPPLVTRDIGRTHVHVDLRTDLADPEEVAHAVAHVRRHCQRHADEWGGPGRHDHLELRALERLRDRLRHLLGLDHRDEARRPHARCELGCGKRGHDRRDLDAGVLQLHAQRLVEANDGVLRGRVDGLAGHGDTARG